MEKINWEKILKKIRFDPPFEDYYNGKKVKPGFSIWMIFAQVFLESKNYQTKLDFLDVRIPETFVVLGPNNYYYLKYDEDLKGIIWKTELDINLNEFEKIVES